MILFYLCILMCCSLDIARCVYHVCLSFSNLHFAKKLKCVRFDEVSRLVFVSRRLQLLRLQHPSLRHMIGAEEAQIHKTRRRRTHCRQLKKRLTRTAQVKKERRDYCGTHSMILDKLNLLCKLINVYSKLQNSCLRCWDDYKETP